MNQQLAIGKYERQSIIINNTVIVNVYPVYICSIQYVRHGKEHVIAQVWKNIILNNIQIMPSNSVIDKFEVMMEKISVWKHTSISTKIGQNVEIILTFTIQTVCSYHA